MAQMVISVAELQNKKDMLEALAGSFKSKLEEFKEIGETLHGMWEGDAKDDYMKSFNMDFQKLTQLLKLIIEFIAILQKIISLYKAMELKNEAIANS